MFLQVHEITPSDIRHLHCTDPALKAEVEAVNRSIGYLEERASNLDIRDVQQRGWQRSHGLALSPRE